jgi:lipopolysaccharide export system permease protein
VQIGLGLVLAFVYLTVLKVLEPFGFSGSISPGTSAWAAHVAFLGGTFLYLTRVPK